MKRKIVIKHSSLPVRSPVGGAILWWLLLDRLGAPAWAYGVLWTLVAIGAIAWIYYLFTTDWRDVSGFGDRKS